MDLVDIFNIFIFFFVCQTSLKGNNEHNRFGFTCGKWDCMLVCIMLDEVILYVCIHVGVYKIVLLVVWVVFASSGILERLRKKLVTATGPPLLVAATNCGGL